jgi:hypothetical protein
MTPFLTQAVHTFGCIARDVRGVSSNRTLMEDHRVKHLGKWGADDLSRGRGIARFNSSASLTLWTHHQTAMHDFGRPFSPYLFHLISAGEDAIGCSDSPLTFLTKEDAGVCGVRCINEFTRERITRIQPLTF